MARYIDAEKLKDAFHTDTEHLQSRDEHLFDLIMFEIDETPTADVEEVKHGEWIEGDWVEYDGHGECVHYPKAALCCSTCNHAFKKELLWTRNYCPNCGTKMDGKENIF